MAVPSAVEAIAGRDPLRGVVAQMTGPGPSPYWRRALRRTAHLKGALERRRFRALRREFYEILWRDASAGVGARAMVLPNGLVQISRAGLATFVDQSELMLDSAIMTRVLANKALTYELMAARGLPLPAHRLFDVATMERAEKFLAQASGPVVVKPADGTGGGHGVTTGITTIEGIRAASRHAASFNSRLLVEEQLSGASFRLLYLDGEFIDAVRRDSPIVAGNGRSTIRKLVDAENRRRRIQRPISALSPLTIDGECRNTLAGAGLTLRSVPASGEVVRVKLAVNENARGQNWNVRPSVSPEIVEEGARMVQALGIGFAGLDVTSHDIGASLASGGTTFNEVNAAPGIHHHYLIANPDENSCVAQKILDRLFEKKIGVIDL